MGVRGRRVKIAGGRLEKTAFGRNTIYFLILGNWATGWPLPGSA